MTRRKIANTEIESFGNDEIGYILHRPENYIGSNTEISADFLMLHGDKVALAKDITYIPALYKIFNEVVDNSIDELLRTGIPTGSKIKVEYNGKQFVVEDNGRGVPQDIDKVTGLSAAQLVFADLRTGSNFDDSSGNAMIGRNGVGVSLTNIFSNRFIVQTWNGKTEYKQTFLNNSRKVSKPAIKKSIHKSGTKITFIPDWDFFTPSDKCIKDFEMLVLKRIKDFALCIPGIKFSFNGEDLSVKKIKQFFSEPGDVFGENKHCRIGISKSPFQKDIFYAMGYVNSATTNIGTHVDYISGRVVEYLKLHIKKKHKIEVKSADIKNKLFLFVSLWIPNPVFGSQTKEGLVSPVNKVSERIDKVLTDVMLAKLVKNESLIESIIEFYQLKTNKKEQDAIKKAQKKKKKLLKLVPAQNKKKEENILMICEGDSALTELVNVRNPFVAGIPIRGKLLNVYDLKDLKVVENEELKNLMQAIGLRIGHPAEKLNYGKIGFLTDMDHDGNAIAGLLINFFYKYWPELFKQGKMVRVLSPLYTGVDNGNVIRFYNKDALRKYKGTLKNIKYYKGLGSLGPDEYELMLNQPEYINLTIGKNTDSMLELLYSDDSDARKEWLSGVK